jgi:hypothetical protein
MSVDLWTAHIAVESYRLHYPASVEEAAAIPCPCNPEYEKVRGQELRESLTDPVDFLTKARSQIFDKFAV